jgi:hypothetical protein
VPGTAVGRRNVPPAAILAPMQAPRGIQPRDAAGDPRREEQGAGFFFSAGGMKQLLLLVFLLIGISATACGNNPAVPSPTDAQPPVRDLPDFDAGPSAAPTVPPAGTPQDVTIADGGWSELHPGLERRRIDWQPADCGLTEEITVLRIDPARHRFDVGYDPQGRELGDWLRFTGADVVVNGGYFRRDAGGYAPAGLIVADGVTYGSSYGGFAGMLAVGAAGPELRWLKENPYDPAEPLRAALQSFPLLIKPGGGIGFPEESDDGIRARRTVIAADRTGRFLILVAAKGCFTLRRLSVYLYESDLDLDIALNLDGGPSTGLAVKDPAERIEAGSPLPIVLLLRAA